MFVTNGEDKPVKWATLLPGGKVKYVKPKFISTYKRRLEKNREKLLSAWLDYEFEKHNK